MKVLISNHNYTDESQLLYFLHTEGQDLSKKKKKAKGINHTIFTYFSILQTADLSRTEVFDKRSLAQQWQYSSSQGGFY